MAIPEIEELCEFLNPSQMDLCVILPGAAEVCSFFETFPPSLLELARSLLGQANAALAPLIPIFEIIEAIVAIVDCIEGVYEAVAGDPPDPSKLAACIPNLLARLERLLRLLPQLTMPYLIRSLIDAIIAMLEGIINELKAILAMIERILASRAAPSDILQQVLDCADSVVDAQMTNLERLFGSMNSMIELVNRLGKPIGIELPTFDGALGDDPAAAIAELEKGVEELRLLRETIPLPPTPEELYRGYDTGPGSATST